MNPTLMFIHSAGPQGENQGSGKLTAYLQKELSREYHLIHPNMQTPEDPKYDEWKEQIEKELDQLSSKVILVGHSLGGSVLLKYLSEESFKVQVLGLFIVAAPFWGIDEDWQRSDFFLREDFEQPLKEIPYLFLYHSIDEKIVPFSHHTEYAEKLPHGKRRVVAGEEHLFENGLPELMDDIKNLLTKEKRSF